MWVLPDPEQDESLISLPQAMFTVPQGEELQLKLDFLSKEVNFVSVRTHIDAVSAKVSDKGYLIIELKDEYKKVFAGWTDIVLRASTGILRNIDDWGDILEENRYHEVTISVDFTKSGGRRPIFFGKDDDLHLSFENGKLVLREGEVYYDVEYVYELERYIYVKNGRTLFYPTNSDTTYDPRRRPQREATCYLTPVFHDDDKNDCEESDGQGGFVPTGKCPMGTIKMTQRHYYSLMHVSWNLKFLKPNHYHEGHIHWNGDWDLKKLYYSSAPEGPHMNPGMNEHRWDWSENSKEERHYGDLTNFKADEEGRVKAEMFDNKLNLFGKWSIFGKMCDIHMPKGTEDKHKNRDNDADVLRAVSFGVVGNTGRFGDVPRWDLGPHPCEGYDDSKIHGGKNDELCEAYKKIVMKFPQIVEDMPGFEQKEFKSISDLSKKEIEDRFGKH